MAMRSECESNEHLNVMYYINKFEQARHNFMLEMGFRNTRDHQQMDTVVLEQKINYFKEVKERDLLFIESTLLEIGNKSFTILHEMFNTDSRELVCTMKMVMVPFDRQNRCALPFPNDLRKELMGKMS